MAESLLHLALVWGVVFLINLVPAFMPPTWSVLAFFLIQVFALTLGWLPAQGYTKFSESPTGWLESIALPAISLDSRSRFRTESHRVNSIADIGLEM